MNRILRKSALGACLALAALPGDVLAGRGGGYGGGQRGGGGGYGGSQRGGGGGYGGEQRGGYGGGQRGGGQEGGSSMSHSPSMSQPRSPSGGSGSQSGGQGGYGNRNSSSGNGGAAAAGAGYANKNQSGSHNAGAAAAGAGYSNKNQSTLPNSGAGAAGAAYSNKNQSTLPNGGAAAGGAAYANRNQSTLPNNGSAAGGAAYANRNQSALPNNGAGAAGAAYANRNQSTLPNGGAAAVGAGYANRNNNTLPYGGAGVAGAAYANNNNGYNGLGAAAVGASAWNNNNSGAWANGMGATGVGAWGTGSPQYGYGYSGYSNPYAGGYAGGGGGGQPVDAGAPQQGAAPVQPTNYTQPISTTAAAPAPAAADQATSAFAQARDAFKAGNYDQALQLDQQALVQAPNDMTMHQFLALTLFAQGRYEQAAAPLYAVLSVGPGWDWTTLSGMYPDVDTYTGQLRKLEAYVRSNPESAQARFVLAYQYLCEGHDENAVEQFKAVVKLQPSDTLSAQLVAQFRPAGAPQPAPVTTSSEAAPSVEGKLAGKWSAAPAASVNIALAIGDDGKYTWTVSGPGKSAATIAGSSSLADGVLTLAAEGGQAGVLAGNVTWQDVDHFTFRLVNGPSGDPGLRFAR